LGTQLGYLTNGTGFGVVKAPYLVFNTEEMDSIEYVKTKLAAATHAEIRAVANASGVPFHTVLKIVKGETKNPGYRTVEPLRAYLEARA
jgi:hypothetical protein